MRAVTGACRSPSDVASAAAPRVAVERLNTTRRSSWTTAAHSSPCDRPRRNSPPPSRRTTIPSSATRPTSQMSWFRVTTVAGRRSAASSDIVQLRRSVPGMVRTMVWSPLGEVTASTRSLAPSGAGPVSECDAVSGTPSVRARKRVGPSRRSAPSSNVHPTGRPSTTTDPTSVIESSTAAAPTTCRWG